MKGQFTRSRTGIKLSLIDTNSQSISRNWVTILGVCTEFRSYSTLRNFVEFCYNKASITYVTIPRQTIIYIAKYPKPNKNNLLFNLNF